MMITPSRYSFTGRDIKKPTAWKEGRWVGSGYKHYFRGRVFTRISNHRTVLSQGEKNVSFSLFLKNGKIVQLFSLSLRERTRRGLRGWVNYLNQCLKIITFFLAHILIVTLGTVISIMSSFIYRATDEA